MINKTLERASTIVWLALLFSQLSWAQIEFDPVAGVPMEALVDPDRVAAGQTGSLTVELNLPEGVHITSADLGFFFLEPDSIEDLQWGLVSYPIGAVWEGDTVYRSAVPLTIRFTPQPDFPLGDLTIEGTVGYQICTEQEPIYCTPPVERRFSATTSIVAAGSEIEDSIGGSSVEQELTIEQRATRALEQGSLIALLWIFIGGVLLSFTPCVYPVIPITIAYIGAHSGANRIKAFTLSLVFVLGLALVYSTLGLIAAATGGVFGLSTQSPWVLGFVVTIFLVMGVGMLGAFEIALPSSVQTKLTSGKRTGYVGALFVGATTGLIAAPCVGPVLVALLSWVSSSGNLFLGFLYLFVFACGLGTLFVVIGTFAGALTALPKAGGWMETIKQGFGIILIAAAYYFGRSLVPEIWFTLLVGLGLLMLAGMMGGLSRLDSDAGLGRRIRTAFAVFILLIGAYYTFTGIAGLSGKNIGSFSSPGQTTGSLSADPVSPGKDGGVEWIWNDEASVMLAAQKAGKPVLIDFWADWCAACKELDHKTFSVESVFSMINENYIPLKIDGSDITDEIKAIWARYGVKGLPTVLVIDPGNGGELARFEAFRKADQVLPLLEKSLNDFHKNN